MSEQFPKQKSLEDVKKVKDILNEVHLKLGDTISLDGFQDERLFAYAEQIVNDDSYWVEGMEDKREELKGLL